MADRYLFESDLSGHLTNPAFVVGEPTTMEKDDGDRFDTRRLQGFEPGADLVVVERCQNLAVNADSLIDLDDYLIEHLGQLDIEREQIWTGLIANAQCISETGGGDERCPRTLAFEQCVGCNRRAHAHRIDLIRGQQIVGGDLEKTTDALDRGVVIAIRVFRKELGDVKAAVRSSRDDVGKRATAVNPEIPSHVCGTLLGWVRAHEVKDFGEVIYERSPTRMLVK